ncbi:Oidioi.mRNA.OKI2018_I69.chr1.g3060.t1.cds [Oikopleura dioica]|uniref:Ubiquitin carboxyl-terminal hydrolase n=1 Tax=Oikopleura dioica TaxID=34765 RepID=A0ABN7SXB9_OIKDI|nr:Oidioi.mRNA.OKI2018_I69.chr1.g3060.t1.cds [Oikopleura dioica]
MDAGEWCLLESDPGVFSALIREFGCTGAQVDELWSLDAENFEPLGEVFGLIFLFKWDGKKETASKGKVVNDMEHENLFWAQQVINNACGTQALISILLNIHGNKITLGEELENFQNFTIGIDGESKGFALSNAEGIRKVHNSFSKQQLFELEEPKNQEKELPYHFVSFVPVNGRLWELDGLQKGPIDHGEISCENWIDAARPVLQTRMAQYQEGEVHFNLMACCEDRLVRLEKKLAAETMDFPKSQIQMEIETEKEKRLTWDKDNARRKHNFMPMVVEILKQMAEKGNLVSQVEKAEERTKEAIERRKKLKAAKQ